MTASRNRNAEQDHWFLVTGRSPENHRWGVREFLKMVETLCASRALEPCGLDADASRKFARQVQRIADNAGRVRADVRIGNAMTMRADGGHGRDQVRDQGRKDHELKATADNVTTQNPHDLKARLAREITEHEATRRELADVRRELGSTRQDLEQRVEQRTHELSLVKARFETALHGAKVSVFSQDRDLRYTWVYSPHREEAAVEMIGRTDDEIIHSPEHEMVVEGAVSILAVKRKVLSNGHPQDAEVRVDSGTGVQWYDLHIEPLRDATGGIVGLICAAVDITERKESEAHLRLLMRELTHRSKNLLAVIQAMARQTALQGGTVANFLERFGARLQALSRSHDLLVQESWHGASLQDLVRSQLGHYFDRDHPQVSLTGPDVHLQPEAAQSVGLALHELATNAAKYGALSRARGRVAIECRLAPVEQGGSLEIIWSETKGPKVGEPRRRGFGSMVIEHNLARALNAEVELSFEPDGLRCRISVPSAQLSAGR